jgi:3-methyladenine DNA glycosylase/8-oxoguanine DNA glycosylase
MARERAVKAAPDAAPAPVPDGEVTVPVDGRLDLRLTLSIHGRGAGDPCLRFEASGSAWRTSRTPDGPVTLFIEARGAGVRARAWGPGSGWALARVGALVGADDDPSALQPRDRAVAEAVRKTRGLRQGRTGRVLEALLPAILEQKVTGDEARRVFRGVLARYGEAAPGGFELRVSPAPAVLAALPYHAFHPLGLERRRAELVRFVCREAPRLERLGGAVLDAQAAGDTDGAGRARDAAYAALRAIPGIGPWTVAEVGARAFGDPDAVPVGDFHIPNMVAFALAGEPRGSDARMLELLEPYRGQRGRAIRTLELAGAAAPRYGPRLAPRSIADC